MTTAAKRAQSEDMNQSIFGHLNVLSAHEFTSVNLNFMSDNPLLAIKSKAQTFLVSSSLSVACSLQATGNDNSTIVLAAQRPGGGVSRGVGQAHRGALGQLSEWAQRHRQLVAALQQRVQDLIDGS